MELVQEYRTRLIADVVTGKLDVRKAAASCPGGGRRPGPDRGVGRWQTACPGDLYDIRTSRWKIRLTLFRRLHCE